MRSHSIAGNLSYSTHPLTRPPFLHIPQWRAIDQMYSKRAYPKSVDCFVSNYKYSVKTVSNFQVFHCTMYTYGIACLFVYFPIQIVFYDLMEGLSCEELLAEKVTSDVLPLEWKSYFTWLP